MNRTKRLLSLIVPAAAIAAVVQMPAAAQEPAVGERVAAFEMVRVQRAPEEAARRIEALAEVLTGRDLRAEGITTALAGEDAGSSRWATPFAGDAPSLRLRFLPEHDEIRLLDEALLATPASEDAGPAGAIDAARKFLDQIAQRGLIEAAEYDVRNADIATGRIGGGSMDGRERFERVSEYRVTLRREINGIEVANAGIRLSVHPSGRVAGVRMGGVAIRSERAGALETPVGAGHTGIRRVSNAEIARRFEATVPKNAKAEVAWSKLLYAVPDDAKQAVIEPLVVYSYSLSVPTGEGDTVVSRRKIVGFSVTDPAAEPIDFTAPAREHEELVSTRREE